VAECGEDDEVAEAAMCGEVAPPPLECGEEWWPKTLE